MAWDQLPLAFCLEVAWAVEDGETVVDRAALMVAEEVSPVAVVTVVAEVEAETGKGCIFSSAESGNRGHKEGLSLQSALL